MTPMAIHLGLRSEDMRRHGVPTWLVASEVKPMYTELPPNHVSIGPGHFSHRWQVGPWTNPFLAGHDGTAFEVVVLFTRWLSGTPGKLAQLDELRHKVFVCDCPRTQLYHEDVMAAAIWQRGLGNSPALSVRTVLALTSATRVVSAVPVKFTQETIVHTFKAWCPFVTWDGFQFPLIEDLLLDEVFTQFRTWQQNDDTWSGLPATPRVVSNRDRPGFRMSTGTQTGAASSAQAAPPLIPFGLGPDGHFAFSLMAQKMGTPFEQEHLVYEDLRFAAHLSAHWGLQMPQKRAHAIRILHELGRRWLPVTEHLRRAQPQEVASATAGRHIGLIGLLCILVDWPDPTFMRDLVFGFPCVGFSPHIPSFSKQEAEWISPEDIGNQHGMMQSALGALCVLLPLIRP